MPLSHGGPKPDVGLGSPRGQLRATRPGGLPSRPPPPGSGAAAAARWAGHAQRPAASERRRGRGGRALAGTRAIAPGKLCHIVSTSDRKLTAGMSYRILTSASEPHPHESYWALGYAYGGTAWAEPAGSIPEIIFTVSCTRI